MGRILAPDPPHRSRITRAGLATPDSRSSRQRGHDHPRSRSTGRGPTRARHATTINPDQNGAPAWRVEPALPGNTTHFAVTVPGCPGDLDTNGATDVFDFSTMAANFGAGPNATLDMGDITGDGWIDVFDFAALAAGFGCGAN